VSFAISKIRRTLRLSLLAERDPIQRFGSAVLVVAGTCLLLCLSLAATGVLTSAAVAATERETASWLVRAGKTFQRAGEYTIRGNTRLQDAITAYGEPSSCRVMGSNNHVVARWVDRGIWIDAWTYGLLPRGENGCTSPDLIHVSEIRLTGKRWVTSLGLHVGDRTTKLRRLYPRAPYGDMRTRFRRAEYWLVIAHGPCIGVCTPYEDAHGVDYPRLTAQVFGGRVVAIWVPVFGQGE
jgi:hypothetical protein